MPLSAIQCVCVARLSLLLLLFLLLLSLLFDIRFQSCDKLFRTETNQHKTSTIERRRREALRTCRRAARQCCCDRRPPCETRRSTSLSRQEIVAVDVVRRMNSFIRESGVNITTTMQKQRTCSVEPKHACTQLTCDYDSREHRPETCLPTVRSGACAINTGTLPYSAIGSLSSYSNTSRL